MLANLYVQMHRLKDAEVYCHSGLETAQYLTDSTEVQLIVGNVYFTITPLQIDKLSVFQTSNTHIPNLLSQDSCCVVCV